MYTVRLLRSAEKALRKLPPQARGRIERRLSELEGNPRPPGVRKLSGRDDEWRLRVGDYRVIYRIRDEILEVLVIDVGDRRDVYRRR